MYGTQPTAARRLAQLPQSLANGGAVAFGSRGLSQLRDLIPQMQAMGYPQAASAPAAPPSNTSAATRLREMIPRVEAMGYKQQPQYLARGGVVRGPGTGTSDSIATEAEPGTFIMPADSTEAIGPSALERMGTVPVRLSDGEFEMPPEQVMAVGEAVLELLKDATHVPVSDAPGKNGGSAADRMTAAPQQLANGGLVDDRDRRISQIPTGGTLPAPAADGSQQNPFNNELGRNVVNTLSALPGVAGLPARTAAPAARVAGGAVSTERVIPAAWEVVPETSALVSRAGTAAQQLGQLAAPGGGALSRAASMAPQQVTPALGAPGGQLARMTGQALGPASGPVPGQAARGAMEFVERVPDAGLGMSQAAAPAAGAGMQGAGRLPATAAAGLGGAALLTGAANDSAAELPQPSGAGTAPATVAVPAATGPATAPAAANPAQGAGAFITRDGNSYSGPPNLTGDVQIRNADGTPRSGGGTVSAQNMAAADALAGRQAQESAARVLGQMPAGFSLNVQAPTVLHSGNSWQARNDLRNAEVSANSITNNGGRFDPSGGRNPAALAYSAELSADNAARAAAPKLASEAMQQTAENSRAALREAGDTQRENIRTQGLTLKAVIDARKSGQAPAGYQWAPGGGLTHIPGGPADPNVRGSKAPLNDVQSKALQFGTRMQSAGEVLDKLATQGVDQPGLIKRAADAVGLGAAANWTQSGEQQQVEQAQRDFINAVLRRESGAAIADSEFSNARQQYFPQVGDSPEVIAQKRKNREIATSGVLAEVPDSEKRVNQVLENAASSSGPQATPAGATRTVSRSGTLNGRRVVQYSDGSTEYAD